MSQRGFHPCVLIVETRVEPLYFHISDDLALEKLALNILVERLKSGDYYIDPEKHGPPTPLDYRSENIPAFPESLQEIAEENLRDYQQTLREYIHDVEQFAAIRKALDEQDGKLAWSILQERQAYEYEAVHLVPYEIKYHC